MGIGIGENIKKIRKLKKVTLVQLEKKTGISNGSLSNIENDKRNPSIETLKKISDALCASTNYFTDFEGMLNRLNFLQDILAENPLDKKVSDLFQKAKNYSLTDEDIKDVDAYIRKYIIKRSSNYNNEPLIADNVEAKSYALFESLFYSLGYTKENLNEYQLQYFFQNKDDEEGTSEFLKYLFLKVKNLMETEIEKVKEK
jgi:transcriptional regulator with XRE-family HTH domain